MNQIVIESFKGTKKFLYIGAFSFLFYFLTGYIFFTGLIPTVEYTTNGELSRVFKFNSLQNSPTFPIPLPSQSVSRPIVNPLTSNVTNTSENAPADPADDSTTKPRISAMPSSTSTANKQMRYKFHFFHLAWLPITVIYHKMLSRAYHRSEKPALEYLKYLLLLTFAILGIVGIKKTS